MRNGCLFVACWLVGWSFQSVAQTEYPESVFGKSGGNGPDVLWSWECIGPDVQPFELNPGGRAIPAYAVNRGNGTGRINFIYPDPYTKDRVFACSPTGGLFRSDDNGITWYNAGTDRLPVSGVSAILVDPNDPDRWLIATGDGDDQFMFSDGLWRTFDAGATWENINGKRLGRSIVPSEDPSQYLFISAVVAHPCSFERVFVASNEGLYVTENAWDPADKIRWQRVAEGHFYDVFVYPENPALVVAGGTSFFRSNDCGVSWFRQPFPSYRESNQYPFSRLTFQAAPGKRGFFGAVSCSEKRTQSKAGEGSLWYFDLDDNKWLFIRSLRNGMDNFIPTRARAFAVHPTNERLMLVANVQPVFRSTDGGVNFTPVDKNQMHDDTHHLVWSADGTTVWAGHDGGVSVSFDNGITWLTRDTGIGVANVFGISVAQTPEHQVLFGAYDTGGNLLIDSVWYHVTWGDGFETIIDPKNADIMFATKQNGHINRSINRGLDFEDAVTTNKTRTEWHTWIKAHTKWTEIIYCSGERLMRSPDRGDNWEVILDAEELEGEYKNIYRFFTSEHHTEVLYAYVLDKTAVKPAILRTFNSSSPDPKRVRWEEVPALPKPGWLTGIVIDADNPRQFWVAYKTESLNGKIYRFNGERYIDVTGNLGFAVINAIAIDKDSEERLYVGTNHGVFTRNRRERTWTRLSGLPGTWIRSLDFNYANGRLYVGTYGRGVWHGKRYEP